ncbi:unnamed protein product [Caenorhabditis brenneri]
MLSNCNGCQALSKKLIGTNDQKIVEMVKKLNEAGRMCSVFEQSLVGWKDSWDAREKYWMDREAEYKSEFQRLKSLAEEYSSENEKNAKKVANLSNMLTEVKPMFRAAASSQQKQLIDKLTEERNAAWEYIRAYELNEQTEEQISAENNAKMQKIQEELDRSKELVDQLKGNVTVLEERMNGKVNELILTYGLITHLKTRAELAESAIIESEKRFTELNNQLKEQLNQAKNEACEFKTKHDKMVACYQTNNVVMAATKDWIARRDQELEAKQQQIQEKEKNWKKEDEANLMKILELTDKVRNLTVQVTQLEQAQASSMTEHQEELGKLQEKCKKLEAEKELEEGKKKRKMALLRELVALEDGGEELVKDKSVSLEQ